VKFLCEQCKAKYQIADDKVVGKTVRMKCRKCGHLIEVRSAVTETSVASVPPQGPAGGAAAPAGPPRAPGRPAPARQTSLAASLASTKSPAPKPERPPGALASAFKSNVQREDEVSAPFDMSELSPGDDWYVAVNGVPVGPIRIAEVRRKAALGAVNEDSLVWQEGLDEWRPLRTFPELAATVREAASTGRASLTPPPPEVRGSLMPPPRSPSVRPAAPAAAAPPRPLAPRSAQLTATPAPRSNVVAISSRLATAERLDEGPLLAPEPPETPNPFQPPAAAAAVASAPPGPAIASASESKEAKGSPPWILYAMFAGAIAFGVTAATMLLPALMQKAPPPAPVAIAAVQPSPTAGPNATAATTASAGPDPAASTTTASSAHPAKTTAGVTVAALSGKAATATSTSPSSRSLDISGIRGGITPVPTDELTGNDGPKTAGQCFSGGQVSSVIGQHQVGVRRQCWERNAANTPTANIQVSLTIGPQGEVQDVNATGDPSSVAHCVENDVRGWHFPAMGCSQKTSFAFKFVSQ
jgi:predicted Zn finger-like uncharacterized protein